MQEGQSPSAQKCDVFHISCVTIGGVKKSSLFNLMRGEKISRLFMTFDLSSTIILKKLFFSSD